MGTDALRINQITPGANAVKLGDRFTALEGGASVGFAGIKLYVNSVKGNDNQSGLTITEPKATIQAAVDLAEDYSTIYIEGRFDEDVVTPAWNSGLGAENVTIKGMNGGSGFYPNSPEWRSSNNTTGIPLIIRSVGWSIERVKFRVPTTNVAVKLRYRMTDADVYDASSPNLAACCRILGCWFYGGGTGKYGIDLLGAPYCTIIDGNYFSFIRQASDLGRAITCTASPMAQPFRTQISNNIFNELDGAIDFAAQSANSSMIFGNVIQGSSHSGWSAGKKCDMGPSGNDNSVVGNFFGGDYSITGGYRAGSGDNWIGNLAEDVGEAEVDIQGWTKAVPAA